MQRIVTDRFNAFLGPHAEAGNGSRLLSSFISLIFFMFIYLFGIPLPHCPPAMFIKLAIENDYSTFA